MDGVLVGWHGKRRTGIGHIQGTQDTEVKGGDTQHR